MAKNHLFCHLFPPKLGPKCASSGPLRSWKRWQLVSGRVFGWPLQLGVRLSNTWGMTWGLWNWAILGLPHRTWWFTSENGDSHENGELCEKHEPSWTNGDASEGTHCVTSTRHFSSMPWASVVACEVNSPQHSVISGEASNEGMDSSWCRWFWPSGDLRVCYWKWSIYRSFTYSKWWFSIVMLVYQRVYGLIYVGWTWSKYPIQYTLNIMLISIWYPISFISKYSHLCSNILVIQYE